METLYVLLALFLLLGYVSAHRPDTWRGGGRIVKRFSRIVFLLIALVPALSQAKNPEATRSHYAWRQAGDQPVKARQLARIRVSADLYRHCLHFPHDLRVKDVQGTNWPFYVWQPGAESPYVEYENIPLTRLKALPAESPEDSARRSWAFDTGVCNQPLHRLELELSAPPEWVSPYRICLRNAPEQPWREVLRGEIKRRDDQPLAALTLENARGRYLLIELSNPGTPPLELQGITATARSAYIVFESYFRGVPVLHYGGASRPAFHDLARRTTPAEAAAAPLVGLRPALPNEPEALKKRLLGPGLSTVALLLLSLIVLTVIAQTFKRYAA